ncbi:hypothetical protein ELQ24_12210 [Neisseria meningitidis]|nr:hypothetical protein [Neisseria meningitidis]
MFGNHGLCGLLKEGAHEKSPKCLGGNLGDFGEFCKGLIPSFPQGQKTKIRNLKSRHSHESGNLEMKSNRHLSEITETEQTRFPPARE